MKIFRLFGVAVVAVCMCVNFTACSSGDDAYGGDFASERKLVKMVLTDGDDTDTYKFSYDNQGRLVEFQANDYDVSQYIWGNNTIQTDDTTYTIKNGLVQKSESSYGNNTETRIYTYDNAGRCNENMVWDGDRLVLGYLGDYKYRYNYTDVTCTKGFLPILHMAFVEDLLLVAHPELIGARTKQLPTSATYTNFIDSSQKGGTITYEYEFDSEGYISKIIEKSDRGYTYSYTLTWK